MSRAKMQNVVQVVEVYDFLTSFSSQTTGSDCKVYMTKHHIPVNSRVWICTKCYIKCLLGHVIETDGCRQELNINSNPNYRGKS